MKEIVKRGATSNIMRVFLQDSTSTTGAGKTGLLFSTTGLIIATIADNEATATAYTVAGSTIENITTLGTFAAPTATKCRFKEVDATNFPGVYEIHIADARYAVANSTQLLVSVQCTGVAPVMSEVQLVAVDLLDTVHFGLTAIPNVAQGTTGSLALGNATGQVTVVTNNDKTSYALSGTQTFNVTGNITGNLSGSVGSVTGSVGSIATAGITSIADGVLSRKLNMAGNISDVSVTSVSSATFTGANTYIAGDAVQFITTAPTSFALATKYYVIATSLTATTFQLSATSGGSAITTVSTGAFTVLPIDDRTVRSALRYVRNKVGISGSTMTVSIEDDATSAWTAALTTSPGIDPVTTLDPA
jgi:hypothetical protein